MLRTEFNKLKNSTYLYSIIAFVVVFTLSVVLAFYFRNNLLSQSRQQFETRASELTQVLDNNFGKNVNFLRDIRALFSSSNDVTREEFTKFIHATEIGSKYPGINSITFNKKVTRDEKVSFEESLNNDPLINPDGGHMYTLKPEEDKEIYFYSYYIEPYTPYTTLFGFDISSIAQRADELYQSIETGEPVMTEKVPLVGKFTGQYGFNIFLPVYKNGTVNNTVEERQANIEGVVIGSFNTSTIFNEVFQDQSVFQDLSLKIYTDNTFTDDLKLFDSQTSLTADNLITKSTDQSIAGRVWNLQFTAQNYYGLSGTEKVIPVASLMVGIVFALALAVYFYYLKRSQSQAVESAARANTNLQQSQVTLQNLLDNIDIILFAFDSEGKFTIAGGKGFQTLGVKPESLLNMTVFEYYKGREEYIAYVNRALKGESVVGTSKNGDLTFEIRLTPIMDNKTNKVTSVVGIAQNITERDTFERNIKKKTDELERLNKIMVDRELKMIELKKELSKK